jgi:hypothetical protein
VRAVCVVVCARGARPGRGKWRGARSSLEAYTHAHGEVHRAGGMNTSTGRVHPGKLTIMHGCKLNDAQMIVVHALAAAARG